MNIRAITRQVFASAALSLLSLGAANAGQIATPIIFLGDATQLVCIANNVSNASINVRVRIVGVISTVTKACTLPAGDREWLPAVPER